MHNPHSSMYYSTNHEDDYKIQKKSSLKDILRGNKRGKEDVVVKPGTPLSQTYVQKYYKKTGMSTTIYK